MTYLYLEVLAVQGAIVPALWALYWPRVRPFLKFFAWSTPLALALGVLWDELMAWLHVWVWLDVAGAWVGLVPAEDLLFMVEIYLIPATFAALELRMKRVPKQWVDG